MRTVARLTLTYGDVATATAIAAAVSPDDEGFVKTSRRGRTLTADASADSPMKMVHTLDDYLACVSVAERTAKAARPPGRARRGRA